MSYYTAGDYNRQGGYYRGYYSAGGFWSKLGGIIRSPVGKLITSVVPGGNFAAALGESLGGHAVSQMQASAVQAGPMAATVGGGMSLASHPQAGSLPGHSMQAATSGATPATQEQVVGGTPGHKARAHQLGVGHRRRGGGGGRRRRSSRGTTRRTSSRRRRRRGHASPPQGDYLAAGDVRRAESGRFLKGHRWPKRRRHVRRGGRVSFTTKDGRKVSFNAR